MQTISINANLHGDSKISKDRSINKVAVLSRTEWTRISNQRHKRERELAKITIEADARLKLHQLSVDKVKNWKNTEQGKLQKILKAKNDRVERIENEKKLFDIESARIKAENREKVINNACKYLYYETDRVKNFHKALLLTEVIKERDLQLELQKLKDCAEKASKPSASDIMRDVEAFQSEQMAIKAKQREAAKATAKVQLNQIDEHKRLKQLLLEDAKRESEEIEKLRLLYLEEKKNLDQMHRDRCKQLNRDNLTHVTEINRIRDIIKKQEMEEDDAARKFAVAKIQMMKTLYRKECEAVALREQRLKLMQAKIESIAAGEKNIQDCIYDAILEVKAKEDKKEKEQLQRKQEMLKAIAEYRKDQIERLESQKMAEKLQDAECARMQEEACYLFHTNEAEKLHIRHNAACDLSKCNVETSEAKKKHLMAEKSRATKEEALYHKALEMEEKDFQKYASRNISDRKAMERNTMPMQLAAKAKGEFGLGPIVFSQRFPSLN